MTDTNVREFLLPDLGEGLTEAVIVEWKVAVGDTVTIDQGIVEVESAKSVVELPVPYAGVIAELCAEVGGTVRMGEPLVRVAAAGSEAPVAGPPAETDAAGAASGQVVSGAPVERPEDHVVDPADAESSEYSGQVLTGYGLQESTARLKRPVGGRFKRRAKATCADAGSGAGATGGACATGAVEAAPAAGSGRANVEASAHIDETRNSPVMSPLVRREAQAAGFDARHLLGTGPNGLVLRADVERVAAELRRGAVPTGTGAVTAASADTRGAASSSRGGAPAEDRRIPVTGMRQLIANHMVESHDTVPKVTLWLDVDVTPLMELRKQLQAATDERFSLTTLLARIVVAALQANPVINSSFDTAANEIVEHGAVNLGIAAQTPRGLTVPIVHGAQGMSLRTLRDEIGAIVQESGRGNFPPAKLAGGTFTLNNYGSYGVDGASPIINLPQAAMLGIGRIKERPWVVDGELAVRKVMTVSFVFDHRVCDGDAASAFLTFVTDRIERPALLFADL